MKARSVRYRIENYRHIMRYFRDKTISISIIFPGYFDTDRMRYTARHPDDITCNYTRLCSVRFVDAGQGYGSLAELLEVSGTGEEVL